MDIFIVKGLIREYDMEKANISILRQKEIITDETFAKLQYVNKLERNKIIGKTQGALESVTKILFDAFKEYTEKLIKLNGIDESDILMIVKDAVWIKDKKLKRIKLDVHIQYIEKNTYFMMVEFPIKEDSNNKIQLFLGIDGLTARGSRINKKHESYTTLLNFLEMNNDGVDKKSLMRLLKILTKELNESTENILSNVENKHLIKILKEIK